MENKSKSNPHEAVVKENSTEVETEVDTEEEEIETMDLEEATEGTEDLEETMVTDQRDVSTVVKRGTTPKTVLNVIDSII